MMRMGSEEKKEDAPRERSVYIKGIALLLWVSWELLVLTSAGVLLGWGLHRWLGIPIFLSVVFGLVGLALAFYRIFQASKKVENSNEFNK